MTKYEKIEEKVRFLVLGKANIRNADMSYPIEQGESVEGLVTEIKDSDLYGKVYSLKVKSVTEPVIVTGKKQLNDKLGYGKMAITPVKEGDEVRITWTGIFTASSGKTGFTFDVAVARAI